MEYNKNIILIGFMACGKTTIGKLLSKNLNMNFFDTDSYIENNEKLSINKIFEKYGESHFRDKEKKTVEMLLNVSNTVVSTGGGIISCKENIDNLKKIGKIVFLDIPFEIIKNRLKNDEDRPLSKDLPNLNKLYLKRHKIYFNSANYIIKCKGTPNDIYKSIITSIYPEIS